MPLYGDLRKYLAAQEEVLGSGGFSDGPEVEYLLGFERQKVEPLPLKTYVRRLWLAFQSSKSPTPKCFFDPVAETFSKEIDHWVSVFANDPDMLTAELAKDPVFIVDEETEQQRSRFLEETVHTMLVTREWGEQLWGHRKHCRSPLANEKREPGDEKPPQWPQDKDLIAMAVRQWMATRLQDRLRKPQQKKNVPRVECPEDPNQRRESIAAAFPDLIREDSEEEVEEVVTGARVDASAATPVLHVQIKQEHPTRQQLTTGRRAPARADDDTQPPSSSEVVETSASQANARSEPQLAPQAESLQSRTTTSTRVGYVPVAAEVKNTDPHSASKRKRDERASPRERSNTRPKKNRELHKQAEAKAKADGLRKLGAQRENRRRFRDDCERKRKGWQRRSEELQRLNGHETTPTIECRPEGINDNNEAAQAPVRGRQSSIPDAFSTKDSNFSVCARNRALKLAKQANRRRGIVEWNEQQRRKKEQQRPNIPATPPTFLPPTPASSGSSVQLSPDEDRLSLHEENSIPSINLMGNDDFTNGDEALPRTTAPEPPCIGHANIRSASRSQTSTNSLAPSVLSAGSDPTISNKFHQPEKSIRSKSATGSQTDRLDEAIDAGSVCTTPDDDFDFAQYGDPSADDGYSEPHLDPQVEPSQHSALASKPHEPIPAASQVDMTDRSSSNGLPNGLLRFLGAAPSARNSTDLRPTPASSVSIARPLPEDDRASAFSPIPVPSLVRVRLQGRGLGRNVVTAPTIPSLHGSRSLDNTDSHPRPPQKPIETAHLLFPSKSGRKPPRCQCNHSFNSTVDVMFDKTGTGHWKKRCFYCRGGRRRPSPCPCYECQFPSAGQITDAVTADDTLLPEQSTKTDSGSTDQPRSAENIANSFETRSTLQNDRAQVVMNAGQGVPTPNPELDFDQYIDLNTLEEVLRNPSPRDGFPEAQQLLEHLQQYATPTESSTDDNGMPPTFIQQTPSVLIPTYTPLNWEHANVEPLRRMIYSFERILNGSLTFDYLLDQAIPNTRQSYARVMEGVADPKETVSEWPMRLLDEYGQTLYELRLQGFLPRIAGFYSACGDHIDKADNEVVVLLSRLEELKQCFVSTVRSYSEGQILLLLAFCHDLATLTQETLVQEPYIRDISDILLGIVDAYSKENQHLADVYSAEVRQSSLSQSPDIVTPIFQSALQSRRGPSCPKNTVVSRNYQLPRIGGEITLRSPMAPDQGLATKP